MESQSFAIAFRTDQWEVTYQPDSAPRSVFFDGLLGWRCLDCGWPVDRNSTEICTRCQS